jgi:hypothetical protein
MGRVSLREAIAGRQLEGPIESIRVAGLNPSARPIPGVPAAHPWAGPTRLRRHVRRVVPEMPRVRVLAKLLSLLI